MKKHFNSFYFLPVLTEAVNQKKYFSKNCNFPPDNSKVARKGVAQLSEQNRTSH